MELAEKIDALEAALPKLIKDAIEAAVAEIEPAQVSAEEQAPKEVKVADFDKTVELVEALSASKLGAAGRKRVLDLHKANGEDIATLIAAEEAYLADNAADGDEAGAEESARREAEEQAKPVEAKLPSRWTK